MVMTVIEFDKVLIVHNISLLIRSENSTKFSKQLKLRPGHLLDSLLIL